MSPLYQPTVESLLITLAIVAPFASMVVALGAQADRSEG